ncbi:unnamed protein product [Bemisia tabaci]|uniref:EF-hand domain-containing protein n=1 Tax=Bemisia tabaci TaxID=7038 RepID=A0A9P0FA61_BEMTA|nr:PREDICTED: myosin regulatory light chain 2 [Bemisia tabaci]CAH0394760.1 unnamed protein product [Bemisia tabaci]
MADKEKKTKKKKKEEPKEEAPPPKEPTPPPPEPEKPVSVKKKSSSKKVKRSGSNVFSMFTQTQVAEFKEGFALMDHDKDGIIGKNDLSQTFDQVGKLVNEKELDAMLEEAPGPINFTQLLSLFAARMSGGSDDDATVINAFKAFDEGGMINGKALRHALQSWGDKFEKKEVDEIYDNLDLDDKGYFETDEIIQLLLGSSEDE